MRCLDNEEVPVDAVFVIGTGSVDGNRELRYALRNLEKNCRFVRDVYICGFCPPWVDKTQVKHLNWPDRFTHAKDANIIDKLRHACEHPGIAKRILFCSDDQFQTRKCTWDDFEPRYLRKYNSRDPWYASKRRLWHTRLRKTLERECARRRALHLDAGSVFYYQPHIWMPMDRDLFLEYAKWSGYERRTDTIIASGYYNFAMTMGRPDFDHVFITGRSASVPAATHVAYNDDSYRAALSVMERLFPDRCRFEIPEPEDIKRANVAKQRSTTPVPRRKHDPVEYGDMDPTPAGCDEIAEIMGVASRIREEPAWSPLLGEVSRAEEMRLFGVRGWRVVWRDLISRWRVATHDGVDIVPVDEPRGPEASKTVQDYRANPSRMRTVRFGAGAAPSSIMDPLRDRVRQSLKGRM